MNSLRISMVILTFLFFLFTLNPVSSDSRPKKPVVRFGVVIDGPWKQNQEIVELFKKEIIDLLSGEFEVRFPKDKRITAERIALHVAD